MSKTAPFRSLVILFITMLITCGFSVQTSLQRYQSEMRPSTIILFSILDNKYFVAGGIPFIILIAIAICKKIARKSRGYEKKDFYLGVDAALTALSSGVIHISDLSKKQGVDPSSYGRTATFIVIAIALFLYVLSLQQDLEDASTPAKSLLGKLWLSNIIGCGLLSCFVFIVKGVQ